MAETKPAKKLVRVVEAFMMAVPKGDKTGRPAVVISAGEIYYDDDKLVKKYPHLFGPVDELE